MSKTKIQQNGWRKVKLGDVIDVRDGTHDSPKQKTDGKFLVTSKNITGRKIDFSSAYKISEEDFIAVNKRSKVDKWDILFSMIGTVAETVIVDFEPNFAIKNVGLFKCGNKDLAKWIYYYLRSNQAKSEIYARLRGSTQPYITLGDLRALPIEFPPLPEQKAIAEVLSSLDDKIDLLHRENKTLEEMAQALFRKWFVEEAKEDWEDKPLGEVVNIKYGKNLPTKNFTNTGYPVFGANGKIGFYKEHNYKKPQVLISCRGEASGKVNISFPKSFITNNSLILEIQEHGDLTFEFVKYYSLSTNFKKYISGSAQPQITIESLALAPIIIPNKAEIIKFSKFTNDIEEKLLINQSQIRTLENLRNTLLPKLMSGEVRLKDFS